MATAATAFTEYTEYSTAATANHVDGGVEWVEPLGTTASSKLIADEVYWWTPSTQAHNVLAWTRLADSLNCEVVGRFRFGATVDDRGGPTINASGTNTYLAVTLHSGTTAELRRWNAGSFSSLGTIAHTYSAGTWHWIRLRRESDTTVEVRVWADGSAEPGTWGLTVTESALTTPGRLGFYSRNVSTEAGGIRCSLLGVATAGDTAPTSADLTLPLTGVASAEALGVPTFALTLPMTGVASAEALGVPTFGLTGDQTLIVTGVSSGEAAGTAVITHIGPTAFTSFTEYAEYSTARTSGHVDGTAEWSEPLATNISTKLIADELRFWNPVSGSAHCPLVWNRLDPDLNCEIAGRVMIGSTITDRVGLAINVSGTAAAPTYVAVRTADGTNIQVISWNAGSFTTLSSVAHPHAAGAWLYFRLRRENDTTVRARWWADGAVEPTSWQVDVAETQITAPGPMGVLARNTSTETGGGRISKLGIATRGAIAPLAADISLPLPPGVGSATALGVPQLNQEITPAGIASAEALGVPFSALTVAVVDSIASATELGVPSLQVDTRIDELVLLAGTRRTRWALGGSRRPAAALAGARQTVRVVRASVPALGTEPMLTPVPIPVPIPVPVPASLALAGVGPTGAVGVPTFDVALPDPTQPQTLVSAGVPATPAFGTLVFHLTARPAGVAPADLPGVPQLSVGGGGTTPAFQLTRLGWTQAEKDLWNTRRVSGPYRVAGDVSANSPGDWTRIDANADSFRANPSSGRWKGPVDNNPGGCVLGAANTASDPTLTHANRLRDCAFRYFLTGVAADRDAVKGELLALAAEPGLQFSNRSRWCLGKINDLNPGFEIAHWGLKLLYAYDWIGRDSFTSAQLSTLDSWFYECAEWQRHDVDTALNKLFVNRLAGNYTLTSVGDSSNKVGYYGGPVTRGTQLYYNNRRFTQSCFVGLVGCYLRDSGYMTFATRVFREQVDYAYFPQGSFSDFHRWSSGIPTLGWSYAGVNLTTGLLYADMLARHGDRSLLTYETSGGARGTQGAHHNLGLKSYRTMAIDYCRYVDGTYNRKGTDQAANNDEAHRIKPNDGTHNSHRVADIGCAIANAYYQTTSVKAAYMRTASGAPGYPSNPSGFGAEEPWQSYVWLPGALFMFGQTEGAVFPYPPPG